MLSGFGLEVICSLTFVIMFLPKKRQRTALGKDDVYENIASNMMKRIQFPTAYSSREKDRGGYGTGQGDRRQGYRERNKDTGQRTNRLEPVIKVIVNCEESIHTNLNKVYLPHQYESMYMPYTTFISNPPRTVFKP